MMTARRVLIVHPYGIGDLLFVTPILRALRLDPRVEKMDLLLGSRTEAIVRNNPHIDEIFSVDKDEWHSRNFFGNLDFMQDLGRKLRRQKYDLLIDFSMRGEYAFFSQFFLGIKKRVGFNYKNRGFFHTHRYDLKHGFEKKHVVDYYCDLAELAGFQVNHRCLEYYSTEMDQQEAAHFINSHWEVEKPFIVIAPGGGESWGKDAHFKQWPSDFFADFINRFPEKEKFEGIILLGSKKDKDLAINLEKKLTLPCLNMSGELSMTQSAALLEKATLFIGNDGGLMHLAHALRVPSITFFGPVDPVIYGAYPAHPRAQVIFKTDLECRPCYKNFRYNSACLTRECLQQLSVNEAFKQLDMLPLQKLKV